MERDFLGLGSKNAPPFTVKEEATEGSKDSGPMRGSGMQWSFSNKASAIPQFLSFKPPREEKPRNTVHDPIASSGFMSISTADNFDSNQKPYSRKNTRLDKQAGNHHAMTNYSIQHFDASRVNRSQEMRTFPLSNQQNQTIAISMSTPVLQSHFVSTGHNLFVNPLSSQPLGGVPIVTPVSVPPNTSSIVGTTDLRNSFEAFGAPAQLTIFYAGSVCVYDDVTPEKAQAIMLLAGNESAVTQSKTRSTAQVQAPIPSPIGERFVANKTHDTPPCSGLPSPIFIASCSTNELAIVRPVGTSASSADQTEPPKMASLAAHPPAPLVPAVAIPQARQASLARFLEKRKERVMNTSPYNGSKKYADCSNPGSDCVTFSVSSSSSSFPSQTSN